MRPKSGRFIENTNVAVSDGENPWMPRDRDRSRSMSRTRPNAGDWTSVTFPPCVACWSSFRNSLDWARSSDSLIFEVDRNPPICSRSHSSSKSVSYVLSICGMTASLAGLTGLSSGLGRMTRHQQYLRGGTADSDKLGVTLNSPDRDITDVYRPRTVIGMRIKIRIPRPGTFAAVAELLGLS